MKKNICRISGGKLFPLIDLGNQYISDFVSKDFVYEVDRSSLKVGYCSKSKLAQLYETYSQKKMYSKYWYQSGINETMIKELNDIVNNCLFYKSLDKNDVVLDIASNDGTLLKNYNNDLFKVGIDPSDVAKRSTIYKRKNFTLINEFFSKSTYLKQIKRKASIVTIIAMFYDLNDPLKFLNDLRSIIKEDGIAVIQISYTPLMLEQNEFGFISHEHLCYFTLANLKSLLEKCGFNIFDVQLNSSNGGSIRVFFTPNLKLLNFPENHKMIGQYRLNSILGYEAKQKVNNKSSYLKFKKRIDLLKKQTILWLYEQKKNGKKVIGYGASTKGNVLLQYYGISSDLLPFIAERSIEKHGLFTAGSGIEIISENEMRRMKPDYLFALPWFFINSFIKREEKLIQNGTKFVVPQPNLKILG